MAGVAAPPWRGASLDIICFEGLKIASRRMSLLVPRQKTICPSMNSIQPLQLMLQDFLADLLREPFCIYAEVWDSEKVVASRGDPAGTAEPEVIQNLSVLGNPYVVLVRRVPDPFRPPLDAVAVRRLGELSREREVRGRQKELASDALARTLDFVTDAFVLVGYGWEVLHANTSFEKLAGYSSQDLAGHSLWVRCGVCANPGIRQHLLRAMAEGQSREIEWWSSEVDRWLSVRMFPCTEGLTVFIQDITSRKNEEQTRMELQRQVSQGQRMEALGTLAAGIAHDFNNVLSAVIGHAGMLREKLEDKHPARLHADEISIASARARDLTGRILAYSRASHGETDKQPVKALTRESVGLLKATLPTTVRLNAQLDGQELCARIRPSEMQQIVINLCTNAWQALPGEKGHVTVTVGHAEIKQSMLTDTGVIRPGSYVVVTVEDDGIGMTEDVRAHLFEPFFTTKPRGKGTGLGLYVVCGIVGAREGGIRVISTEGRGARFEVFIPSCEDKIEVEGAATSPSERGHGERVAYVDDDPVVSLMVEQLLSSRGFEIAVFSNARDALDRLAAGEFDIIVTDQNMPDMSGVELAAAVRSCGINVPIILSTGHVSQDLYAMANEAGICEILPKERSFEDLPR